MSARAKTGKLEKLQTLLDEKKEFEITEYEYTRITGGTFSKDISYLKNKSALAKFANDNDYYLEVIPLEIRPMKLRFRLKK